MFSGTAESRGTDSSSPVSTIVGATEEAMDSPLSDVLGVNIPFS